MCARLLQQVIPRPPEIPGGSKFLDVVFDPTRARLRPPEGELLAKLRQAGLDWKAEEQRRVPPNVLRLALAGTAWLERRPEVESEGERLGFVKLVFRDGALKALAVYTPSFGNPGSGALELRDLDAVLSKPTGTEDYLAELYQATEPSHGDPPEEKKLKRFRRFFYTFDLHTSPTIWDYLGAELPQQPGWDQSLVPDLVQADAAIGFTMTHLTGRMIDRVGTKTQSWVSFESLGEDQSFEKTKLLSKLQLALYTKKHGGLSKAERDEAFDWFARGRLRIELPGGVVACQPSSGFHFFFGEFALLALDNGLAPTKWKELGRVLVRTQEIFARTYAPKPAPAAPNFDSYESRNYPGPGIDDARIQQLHTDFAGLDEVGLEAKAVDNATAYLAGL